MKQKKRAVMSIRSPIRTFVVYDSAADGKVRSAVTACLKRDREKRRKKINKKIFHLRTSIKNLPEVYHRNDEKTAHPVVDMRSISEYSVRGA